MNNSRIKTLMQVNKWTDWKVALLFLFLTILARLFIFYPSVIDHDESTYIIIADQLLQGKIPYVDNIEIKPIGIFLMFAGALKMLGNTIFSIRLLTVIVIASTAFILYKAKKTMLEKKYALLVGFAYIILTSLHKWTWSPNTEVFFNLFTSLGLLTLLSAKKTWHYFAFGFIMGIGFITKYVVIFEMAAFGLFFLFTTVPTKQWKSIVISILLMGIGFFMPLVITALTYFNLDYWDEFVFATFTIPSNYSSEPNIGRFFAKFGEIHGGYFPISLLFIISLIVIIRSKTFKTNYKVLAISWYTFSWLAIYLPGKFPHHYALQILLPMAFFMFDVFKVDGWLKQKIKPVYVYAIIFIMIGVSLGMQYDKLVKKTDYTQEIANYLNDQLSDEDQIFVMARNIIYYLCEKEVPNKYVHTTLMIRPDHIKSFQVNVEKEFDHIKKLKPKFIVLEWRYANYIKKQFGEYLDLNYEIAKSWDENRFVCYRLK